MPGDTSRHSRSGGSAPSQEGTAAPWAPSPACFPRRPFPLWLFHQRRWVRGRQKRHPGGRRRAFGRGRGRERSKRRQRRRRARATRPPCRCRQGCCGEGLESWLHGRVSGSPEAHWLSLPLRPLALGADPIPYSKSRGGSRAQWGTRRPSLDTPFPGPVAHPLCRLLQASSDPQIRVAPCAPPRVTCSANAGTAEDSRSPPGGEPQSCRR